MKNKKLILMLGLLILSAATFSLSGCGLFTVNSGHSGNQISHNKLSSVAIGSTQNEILTKFGEPTKQTKMKMENGSEDVWYYCWSKGSGGTFLYGTFSDEGDKTKCATFIFNKKGNLVSKGIGAGAEPSVTTTPAVIPVY